MIFDTWFHLIPSTYINRLGINSISMIIQQLRKKGVLAPVIGLPFKAGPKIVDYSYEAGIDVLSIDWAADIDWVCKNINKELVTQGNLDPALLNNFNKDKLDQEIEKILSASKNNLHIFNVGHGLMPEAKINTIKYVINYIRSL